MFNNNQTLRQSIYKKEAENFYDSIAESQQESNTKISIDDKGYFIGLCKQDSKDYQALLNDAKFVDKSIIGADLYNVSLEGEEFLDYISGSSQEISGEYRLSDALNIIGSIRVAMKDTLYGAMLLDTSNNAKINPLHPLVAMQLVKENNQDKRYSIFIFTTEHIPEKDLSKHKASLLKRAQENIAHQIVLFGSCQPAVSQLSPAENKNSFVNNLLSNEDHELKFNEGEANQSSNNAYIIPNQLLTQGIAIPYYGTSIVNYTDRAQGFHASPMLTPNISRCGYRSTISSGAETDSVCTGNLNNTTIKGLKSLTHSNLSSPYFRYIIIRGWQEYVSECINASFTILKNFISTDIQKQLDIYQEPIAITPDTIWNEFENKLDGEPNPFVVSLIGYKDFFSNLPDNDWSAKKIMARYRKYKKEIEVKYEESKI